MSGNKKIYLSNFLVFKKKEKTFSEHFDIKYPTQVIGEKKSSEIGGGGGGGYFLGVSICFTSQNLYIFLFSEISEINQK